MDSLPRRSRSVPFASRRSGRGFSLVAAILMMLCIAVTGSLFVLPEEPVGTEASRATVTAATDELQFGTHAVGDDVVAHLYVTNTSRQPLVLRDAVVYDHDATDFDAELVEDTPFTLNPGDSTRVAVTFTPGAAGVRTASLQLVHTGRPVGTHDPVVSLSGTGLARDDETAALGSHDADIPALDRSSSTASARGAVTTGGSTGSPSSPPTSGGSQAVTSLGGGGGGQQLGGPSRVHGARTGKQLGPGMTNPGGGGGGGSEPTIATMTATGGSSSNDEVTLSGSNFAPGQMTIFWGNDTIDSGNLTSATSDTIVFDAPDHAPGLVWARVETAAGSSNKQTYLYTPDGGIPIDFDFEPEAEGTWPDSPTCGDWGPDGRLYVGTLEGKLYAITFDENYNSIDEQEFDGVSDLSTESILGLTFNPWDDGGPVRVYVAHTELFAQGGGAFSGPSPYPGAVSILSGPDFDDPDTIITGLPASNHDHGMNGMVFDNNGDLLMCAGGTTNAGIEDKDLGDVPESPLSGALIRARTSLGGSFNGDIEYVFRADPGTTSDDQVDGHDVILESGVDLDVFAPGLRASFDLVLHTNGYLYASDNGPNNGFGDASTGPNSDDGSVAAPDEICLIEPDEYYGHPNRARGPDDARQFVYHYPDDPPIPGQYVAPLAIVSSSTNGIDEYRGTTFESAMRGDLLAQRWKSKLAWGKLSSDGRTINDYDTDFTTETDSLGLRYGPGGAIVGMHYQGSDINVLTPIDAGAFGMLAYDVTPWRAPATGGTTLVIGGDNFTSLGETTVTIGGNAATVLSVSTKRILVSVPSESQPTTELLDVFVRCGDEGSTIADGFRYLLPVGTEPGTWNSLADMPTSVGPVAAGLVAGKLIVVGGDAPFTLAYDLPTRTWEPAGSRTTRPFPGSHHAAEVYHDKLYLFGGVGAGSAGRVQIYDPSTDSWTIGYPMPWDGGACASALIGDKIYVAGGHVNGGSTTTQTAVYDPATDTWTRNLARMPAARNQAQTATDGERMWVFGGRGPGSGNLPQLANGFGDIQVYDPATDSWTASAESNGELRPMPAPRGGGGKAVFHQGVFRVFGGATVDGPGATADGVFDRVDVYDPASNTWTTDTPMPTARHGIHPVLDGHRILIVGGGETSISALSTTAEVYLR